MDSSFDGASAVRTRVPDLYLDPYIWVRPAGSDLCFFSGGTGSISRLQSLDGIGTADGRSKAIDTKFLDLVAYWQWQMPLALPYSECMYSVFGGTLYSYRHIYRPLVKILP